MGTENEEIVEYVKNYVEAHNSGDLTFLEPNFATCVCGFGWRSSAWRDHTNDTTISYSAFKQMFEAVEYYTIELDELHTWAQGDIGLAWGVWTESYHWKGGQPGKAKVRMTMTLYKESEGWRQLMYHRDIQPFDENGLHLTEYTQVK